MKCRYIIISFIIAFFVQGSLINLISIFDITPNLILCLVTGFAFMCDKDYFIVFCTVLTGLCVDICYTPYIGMTAMSYFIICVSVILIKKMLSKESIVATMSVMAIVTILFEVVMWIIALIFGAAVSFLLILHYLPLKIIFNIAVIAAFYKIVSGKVIRYRNDRYYR